MRADERQSLREAEAASTANDSRSSSWGWCLYVASLVINAAAAILLGIVLVIVLMHTDGFSDVMTDHLSNSEYKQIAGSTIQVNSLNADDDPINRITFESPVVFEGSVTVPQGPTILETTVTTDVMEVLDTLLVEIPTNGTTSVRVQTLIERIEEVRGQCGFSESVDTVFETLAEFLEYITLEWTADRACLEAAEALLVELQGNNTASTTNHNLRLDALENGTCAVSNQITTDIFVLQNLDANMTALNVTIVSTDATLEVIRALLDDIVLDFPALANVSCDFSHTMVNTTITTLQDLRVQLNGTQTSVNASAAASATCSATMLNITTALNTYETILDTNNATYFNLFELFAQTSGNLTALTVQHNVLDITASSNNVSLLLYTTEYAMCNSSLVVLQEDVDALWAQYNALNGSLSAQQTLYESYLNDFNVTYTLFNTSAPDCDAELELYNNLVTSFNALSLQYQTDYVNILAVIDDANAQLLNVTSLEAAIAALESNLTSINTTLSGLPAVVSAVNATLQQADANLGASELALNNTRTLLTQANTTASAIPPLVTALNGTIQALEALIANQTARLVDHEIRIADLEAFVCPIVPITESYIAGSYVAGENLTRGDVAALNSAGEAVKARGLYIKNAYQVSSTVIDEDALLTSSTVPIDSSDHFYASYQLRYNSTQSMVINGVSYNSTNVLVVKFSPAHEVLWVATMRYPDMGARSGLGLGSVPVLTGPHIIKMTLDEEANELFIVGTYYGDDEDSEVDLFNADQRYSGLSTPRLSPSASTETQIGTFFASISAAGEWRNIALTDHSSSTSGSAETIVTEALYAGNRKVIICGSGYQLYNADDGQPVIYPGGFAVQMFSRIRLVTYTGLFNLDTFEFEYVQVYRPTVLLNGTYLISGSGAIDSSRDAAFISFFVQDRDTNGQVLVNVPAVSGPTIVLSMTGGNGVTVDALVVLKIEIATGLAYWAQISDPTSDSLYDIRNQYATNNFWRVPDRNAMSIDHYDRPWIALNARNRESPGGVQFTYDGVTAPTDAASDAAFLVLRLSPRDGAVLDLEAFLYFNQGPVENERFETSSFVRDSTGYMFLALRFNGETLQINNASYATPGQASTTIVKMSGSSDSTITVHYVYFDDYSNLAFAIDSHDNIWAFLHEGQAVAGDVDTFGVTGTGIAQFGQLELEPLGLVAADQVQGQTASVVYSGPMAVTTPTFWGNGRNLFNDHGVLTPENVYGKPRVAVMRNLDNVIVNIHRSRITEPVR